MVTSTIEGTSHTYVYDGDNRRVSVANSTTTRQYYSAVGVTLEKRGNQTVARYVRDPYGKLVLISNADGIFYYLYDGSGNVVGLIKSNGTVGYYGYQPFGEDVGTPYSTYNPYQYASTYRDQGSADKELYYMMARYQDPAYGRFGQADYWEPSWLPGAHGGMFSPLEYGYVGSDPLLYSDPYGHCILCGVIVVVAVVEAAKWAANQIFSGSTNAALQGSMRAPKNPLAYAGWGYPGLGKAGDPGVCWSEHYGAGWDGECWR